MMPQPRAGKGDFMNGLPLHPVIVHVPLVIALLVPVVLALLTWFAWRGRATRIAWAGALALQALVVGGGLLALQTGEAEEERVEDVVAESAIEEHEERASLFVWAAAGVLVLAGAAFAFPRAAKWLGAGAAAAAVAVGLIGVSVGHAGGELVYRDGAASVYTSGAAADGQAGTPAAARGNGHGHGHGEDDDDD
jgi:hypothetical protein